MSMSLFTSAWNWNCSPSFLAGAAAAASSDLMPTLTPAHGLEACAAVLSEAACCSRAVVCAQSAARTRKSFISARTCSERVDSLTCRQEPVVDGYTSITPCVWLTAARWSGHMLLCSVSTCRPLTSQTERSQLGWARRALPAPAFQQANALLSAARERAADCAQLLDPPPLQQAAARLPHHLGPRPAAAAPLPEAHGRRGARDRRDVAGAALGETASGQVLPRRGHQPLRAAHPRREDRLCGLDLEHGGGAAHALHTTLHAALHAALHMHC